jgi:hypothetical protein
MPLTVTYVTGNLNKLKESIAILGQLPNINLVHEAVDGTTAPFISQVF